MLDSLQSSKCKKILHNSSKSIPFLFDISLLMPSTLSAAAWAHDRSVRTRCCAGRLAGSLDSTGPLGGFVTKFKWFPGWKLFTVLIDKAPRQWQWHFCYEGVFIFFLTWRAELPLIYGSSGRYEAAGARTRRPLLECLLIQHSTSAHSRVTSEPFKTGALVA